MKTIRLVGMAHEFGSVIDTNPEVERRYNLPSGFVLRKTGVKQRHFWSHDQEPVEVATRKAKELLQSLDIPLASVQAVFGSSNPYGTVIIPSPTFRIAHALDLPHRPKVSHVNYGCGGYFSGLEDMWCWLQFQPEGTFALFVLTDHPSSMVNDHGTAVLFSDAIHVSVWTNSSSRKGYVVDKPWMKSAKGDINVLQLSLTPRSIDDSLLWKMDGYPVWQFVMSVSDLVMQDLGVESLVGFDIVPHQPNVALLDALEEKYKLPFFKEVVREHGNPTCSGTMIALEEFLRVNQSTRPILAVGFGDSLSYGGMILRRE